MSLKKAAQEVFKGWATPEEVQEFGKKLVADLEELGFRDRTIPEGMLPEGTTVLDELVNSAEDNIYHFMSSPNGGGMFLRGEAFQPPYGGKKWSPGILYVGLAAGRTGAIYIAEHKYKTGHTGQSFQWKDREMAERKIVEWLADHAGNDVRAKLGWTDALNALFKPAP